MICLTSTNPKTVHAGWRGITKPSEGRVTRARCRSWRLPNSIVTQTFPRTTCWHQKIEFYSSKKQESSSKTTRDGIQGGASGASCNVISRGDSSTTTSDECHRFHVMALRPSELASGAIWCSSARMGTSSWHLAKSEASTHLAYGAWS